MHMCRIEPQFQQQQQATKWKCNKQQLNWEFLNSMPIRYNMVKQQIQLTGLNDS